MPKKFEMRYTTWAFNKVVVKPKRGTICSQRYLVPYVETDPSDYYENPERQKNTLYSSMADCQLVLRYFALRDDSNIRGSTKAMLELEGDGQPSQNIVRGRGRDYIKRIYGGTHLA